MKKLRLLLLPLLAVAASASIPTPASAALLCPAPTYYCRYANYNGCCIVVASAPGYSCPQNCD